MKVAVYHNVSRDASFGLNAKLTKQGKIYENRSHELVRVFQFELSELFGGAVRQSPDAIAQEAFLAFNVGDEPHYAGTELHELAKKYRARRLRSLSVGDVLDLNGLYLECRSVGWGIMREEDLNILDAKAAEPVIRARYEFKPAEELAITVPLEG